LKGVRVDHSIRLPYRLKTFQGSRYALFAYNTAGKERGYADSKDFTVFEPLADRSKNIPAGKIITLTNMADNSLVRANPHGMSSDVRLIKGESEGSVFQWQVMLHSQCMLLSLKTHRYVGLIPGTGEPYSADHPGPLPSRKDGTVFIRNTVDVQLSLSNSTTEYR